MREDVELLLLSVSFSVLVGRTALQFTEHCTEVAEVRKARFNNYAVKVFHSCGKQKLSHAYSVTVKVCHGSYVVCFLEGTAEMAFGKVAGGG